jgi:hypothetical protein
VADEIEIAASFSYAKDDAEFSKVIAALQATVSGDNFIHHKQLVGTSEEALVLGEVSGGLGWALFRNLDATNYLEIRSGTGAGNDIIKIPAGKFALFHFGSDITAPYAVANSAACLLEYFISEA